MTDAPQRHANAEQAFGQPQDRPVMRLPKVFVGAAFVLCASVFQLLSSPIRYVASDIVVPKNSHPTYARANETLSSDRASEASTGLHVNETTDDRHPTVAPTMDQSTVSPVSATTSAPTAKPTTEPIAPISPLALSPTKSTSTHPSKLPYCLRGCYGQSSNRMITLAKALRIARTEFDTHVALNREWSNWYIKFYDPRPDVQILSSNRTDVLSVDEFRKKTQNMTQEQTTAFRNTVQICQRVEHGRIVYRFKEPQHLDVHQGARVPLLDQLIPKPSIRQQAEQAAIRRYNNDIARPHNLTFLSDDYFQHQLYLPFVSVHRRNLDGNCQTMNDHPEWVFGNCTVNVLIDLCQYTHGSVTQMLSSHTSSSSAPQQQEQQLPTSHNFSIVLFTDGQNETLDNTFPIRDDNDFAVQQWMMTLSELHFGLPVSTVDIVIRHWRQRRIETFEGKNANNASNSVLPLRCFPPWNSSNV